LIPSRIFDKVKEKMDDADKENTEIPLTKYISYLKKSIYNEDDRKRIV